MGRHSRTSSSMEVKVRSFVHSVAAQISHAKEQNLLRKSITYAAFAYSLPHIGKLCAYLLTQILKLFYSITQPLPSWEVPNHYSSTATPSQANCVSKCVKQTFLRLSFHPSGIFPGPFFIDRIAS